MRELNKSAPMRLVARFTPPAVGEPIGELEYRPFPDVKRRNFMQEKLEVTAMVWALQLTRGGRVLEIGCGRGIALPPLARALRPRRLVGIDINDRFLDDARRRVRGAGVTAELYIADVRALPFPDQCFDVVIDFGTCYHIARAGHALAEIARVLEPSGVFVEETRLSQLLSHPFRSFRRHVPWSVVPDLCRPASRLMWERHSRH